MLRHLEKILRSPELRRTESGAFAWLAAAPGCAESSYVACGDDPAEIDLEVPVEGGTYWLAVGLKGAWLGEPAELDR